MGFRLTIGTKLMGLIAVLLMGSVASLMWLSTRLFIEDNTALIQNINADTATGLSARMREFFESSTEKMRVIGMLLVQPDRRTENSALIQDLLGKDKDFLALFVNRHDERGAATVIARSISPDVTAVNDETADKTSSVLASKGEIQVTATKLADGTPGLAITVPFIRAEKAVTGTGTSFSHTLTAIIRQARFLKTFGETDVTTAFMVDRSGRLLAHPDGARVLTGENVSHLEIVKQMLEAKFNNSQTRYFDPQSNEWKLGAYRLVGFGGLGVVAEVPEAKAFETAHQVERRSMYVAMIVLCLSFLLGYLYSGTITWPIKQLVAASRRISSGDFSVQLKPRGRDEVATLSHAFNEMVKGLEERDRVKATFNKFHNKEIAEKLLSGEVKLGGEKKEAVIFFSDVRGFTALSESMQPEQVVEMLNEYMTEMVAVIRAHHGIVDKYVGDAIMALWGVPLGGEDDAYCAVMACLKMRQQLEKLNTRRIARGQPVLKIGMGVNVGPVIAGNIGSTEKMEYTVIGDSVNLASRIESMTKTYGTDLLVSQSIHERIKDRFIFEECQSAHVKGKTQAVEVYKVSGYVAADGVPVVVKTPYSSYKAEHCDKVKSSEPATLTVLPKAVPPPPPVALMREQARDLLKRAA